jgi:hypothetical protein
MGFADGTEVGLATEEDLGVEVAFGVVVGFGFVELGFVTLELDLDVNFGFGLEDVDFGTFSSLFLQLTQLDCDEGISTELVMGVGVGFSDILAVDETFCVVVFFDFVFGGQGDHGGHSGYSDFLVLEGLLTTELAGADGFVGAATDEGFTGSDADDFGPSPSHDIVYDTVPREKLSVGFPGAGYSGACGVGVEAGASVSQLIQ